MKVVAEDHRAWAGNDAVTAELMRAFYDEWLRGESKATDFPGTAILLGAVRSRRGLELTSASSSRPAGKFNEEMAELAAVSLLCGRRSHSALGIASPSDDRPVHPPSPPPARAKPSFVARSWTRRGARRTIGRHFGLAGLTVEAGYSLLLLEALFPLQTAAALQAFTAQQLQAMSGFALKAHGNGFGIALLLFGPAFLLRGYLVARSGYFPKAVGVLYQLAGLAYLTNSFVLILAPQLAGRAFALIAGPAFIGEATFCLWLLIKGLNVEKWNEYPRI